MTSFVDDLRRKIDARHAEAIAALETIQRFIEESATNGEAHAPPAGKTVRQSRKAQDDNGSIRGAVLKALADWTTIASIVSKTGLTIRQVRGVINAPGVSETIERRDALGGRKEYRIRPKNKTADEE